MWNVCEMHQAWENMSNENLSWQYRAHHHYQHQKFSLICEKSLKYIETIKVLTNHVFQYLGFLTSKHVFMRELTKVNVLMIIKRLSDSLLHDWMATNHKIATQMRRQKSKNKDTRYLVKHWFYNATFVYVQMLFDRANGFVLECRSVRPK